MLSEIWRVVRFRMRALIDRDALESELDEELNFHLEREAERHERAGLSREDAYMLVSTGCDVRITQLVDGTMGAHVMIPKRLFTR